MKLINIVRLLVGEEMEYLNAIRYIKKRYQEKSFVINPTGYFYDLDIINDNIYNLKKNLPSQISLYYAMKANIHPEILKFISNNDFAKGFEIASSGELEIASRYLDYDRMIFTGPGKTEYELELAIKHRIRFINIESVVEAIRIQELASKLDISHVDVLIRVNLNYSLTDGAELMSGCSTKMGIDEDDYISSFDIISRLDRVRVRGIHVFAASGVLDYEALLKSNRYIFDLVKKIEDITHNEVDIIDFGGGLGIDYSGNDQLFDIEKYGVGLTQLIQEYGFIHKEIIMELGTYIVGNAGYYTAKIIDIKKVKGHKHVIIAGGVNHMGLPLEMRRKHPSDIIFMNEEKKYDDQPEVEEELVDISGPLCMVTDKLSWDCYVEKANIGDIVLFRQAGAYCYGEGMHEFLSHMLPVEIILPREEK